jgi:putative hemolysin
MNNFIFVLVILLISAFLSVIRTVFLNVSVSDFDEDQNSGETGARIARMVLDDYARLHVTLRFLHSLSNIFFIGYLLWVFSPVVPTIGHMEILALALISSLTLLILGEMIPQALVVTVPKLWAIRLAPAMLGLTWICSPITSLLQYVANRLGVPPNERERLLVTPDQIKTLVDAGEEGGSIEQDERQMIHSVFQFSDTLVREVMIPRINVLALDVETTLSEAHTAVVVNGYSRIPIYEQTVDNIIGLLYAKDLLAAHNNGEEIPVLRDMLRKPFFVPETKKIDSLLPELQGQRMHMAIVVDEYGGMAGVVTLEDLVEELIGEVQDEYDLEEDIPFRQTGEHEYLVQGRIDIDDLNRKLHTDIDGGDSDTLAGFIFEQLGRVPVLGESIEVNGFMLEVHQVVERQIRWVRVLHRN